MSMKVLIVDADWRFTRQASAYLESHAHHVVHQPDTDLALEQARKWKPDLVVISAEQAETGLAARFKALKPKPAVLLTGWLDRFDRAWRAWQKGGDELLMKPVFKAEELRQAILTAMENSVAHSQRRTVAVSA